MPIFEHRTYRRRSRNANHEIPTFDFVSLGKATGERAALWLRARLQSQLFQLGCFLHRHAGKVLFVGVLVLATFCVGLKSAKVHTRVDQLWVEEGGRLARELQYTRAALGEADSSTHQLVIQTPRHPQASLLHPAALLSHLDVVKAAASVTVQLFDITWRLKDMCYSPGIPNFDVHYIDQIFENIIPCAIITPLDCFWEGAKLLGPDYPVNIPGVGSKVRWTNLNPQTLIQHMKSFSLAFPFATLEDYLKRAGISSGYQEKPCLDPSDPECPSTAPNKLSGQLPDIGAELTGGCYGFAAKYMHWPEDLVVGGATRNKTGHIQRAHALQTVIQLMGEREMFDFWSDTYKVHHVEWTQEKAAQVLETWQRRFSEEVRRHLTSDNSTSPYKVYAFSTATLNDILSQFSELSVVKVVIGYIVMLVYAGVSLLRWHDPVHSQAAVGLAGVVLVSITVAAGLGFCALLGIAFNASTTQIVPFLALGLGVDDLFLMTNTYAEQEGSHSQYSPDEQTGVVLKRTGLSILLTSLSNMCTFFAAAIIPIPALRVFSLQAAVLVLFNLGCTLLVFPAVVSLDLRRRHSGRVDLLCCCLPGGPTGSEWPCCTLPHVPSGHLVPVAHRRRGQVMPEPAKKLQAITRALPPDRQQTVTVLAPQECWVGSTRELLTVDNERGQGAVGGCGGHHIMHECWSWSLRKLAATHYAPLITKSPVKVVSMVILVVILAGSVWGITKVTDGLDLTDIVPQNTDEHAFLSAQGQYFGFYNMYAVTEGDFEYPTNQKLLYEYHEAFMRVPNIIKNDDGGLPEFWLSLYRDWLIGLQKAFDRDWSRGSITQERWFPNASDEGILAYKLLVQTGHVDNPIDKSLITQVRLVDGDGIINPKAFYNYLSAWASNDALAYGASRANLRPEPRPWYHAAEDFELKIPKSAPLVYTQLPFYLHGLGETQHITHLIAQVRSLCQKFEERGLPNFPSGIPFLFWEQYLGLRQSLGLALLCALSAVFLVVSVLLLNLWAATLVVLALAAMVIQLLGVMGVLGIKLSAVPAVLLIVAVGIGVHFTIHICLGFVTSIGCRDRRTHLALEHMFAPVTHGALTTLLGIIMLAFSEFDFIVRYFFYVLLALVVVGLITGLVFFPVLLSLIGPAAEVIPYEFPDRISTPSPPPSPVQARVGSCRVGKAPPPPRRGHSGIQCNRLHAEPSLTTITEEANSWHSTHEIVVQPEVVVETTTYGTPQNASTGGSGTSHASTSASPMSGSQSHVTTKVTATAHVKVEVHTPLPGTVEHDLGSSSCSNKSHSSLRRDSSSGSEHDSSSDNNSGKHGGGIAPS
ncbi:protein patched isoform X2 [Zootermopsis nevadensis]|uniref:protein patched isoform X2 n=1 Tax=Zootermopsis nevadensis TaxID=136037 RepID=UPI000B8EB699|nr:protein patched isoform X2 [Zootermopsis nevadensis]